MKKWIFSLLTLCFLVGTSVTGAEATQPQGVIVEGSSSIEKMPDQTKIQFTIHTTGKTSEEAQSKNAMISSQIYQNFLAGGIPRNSWKTVQMNLSPLYDYNNSKEKLIGYQMTHRVLVTVDGTTNARGLIRLIAESGVGSIESVQFGLKNPQEAENEALAKAVEDARNRAQVMAVSAGEQIKNVRLINQVTTFLGNETRYRGSLAVTDETGEVFEELFWVGPIVVRAQVQIQFNLAK